MSPSTFTLGNNALPPPQAALANQICADASISPTELYCKWEAWALSNDKSSDIPTEQDLLSLAQHIRDKATKAASVASKTRPSKHAPNLIYQSGPTPTRINVDDFFSYIDAPPPQTPPPQSPSAPSDHPMPELSEPHLPSNSLTSPSDPLILSHSPAALPGDDAPDTFANRPGSGRVEATLNASPTISTTRPPISLHLPSPPSDARYMNDLLPARIEAIRARVQTLSDRILSRVNAARADDDHIHASAEAYFVASPNVVTAVGRVRVELDGSEGVVAGRINPSSVVMESVDGNLLKLDLRRINEAKVPLFLNPGMVVAAEGVNLNGRCMDVHAIYDNCMPVVDRARSTGNATQDDVDTPVASIIVAAGPFTTMDNLKYEPLDELLQVVIRERPHLVLLTGPFVDVAHPHITHATSVPFETVFEKRVLQRIVDARKKMAADGGFGSEFILVPSLDDVNHEPVCPQPRFEFSHTSVGATEVHVVANPCVMKVMSKDEKFEASIGISSLPALQDISADSLCWNKSDRLAAIVSHMLRQQSFYPTFPPGKGVPLDCTMLDGLDVPESNTCPSVDMMIMPSRLKAFAKCVDAGAVGVNPGLSCRGNSGGTYAEICVALHPCDRPRPPNWNEDRTEVGVIRL